MTAALKPSWPLYRRAASKGVILGLGPRTQGAAGASLTEQVERWVLGVMLKACLRHGPRMTVVGAAPCSPLVWGAADGS